MFGREEAPEVELKKLFWEELSDSPFVMLGLQDVEDSRTRRADLFLCLEERASRHRHGAEPPRGGDLRRQGA